MRRLRGVSALLLALVFGVARRLDRNLQGRGDVRRGLEDRQGRRISIPRSTSRNGIASAPICVRRPSRPGRPASSARCSPTCSAVSASRISPSFPSTPDNPGDYVNLSGEPGFDVRMIDGSWSCRRSIPTAGAAAAGVHAGWIVQSIGGTPVSTLLAGIAENTPPRLAQLQAWRLAVPRLRGPSGYDRGGHIHRRRRRVGHQEHRAQARARTAGHRRKPADDVRPRVVGAEADAGRRARPASSASTSG